jgi:3-hydroxymyristoyl/3-hydroxydecanoyl-(acyl carrier protein) dehydratase
VALPRPRALVTTPFHLKTLLRAGLALPEVDLVLSATAPLSPQLAREAEHALQGRLVEIYGCTEAGQVASRRTSAGDIWRTLGELRVERAAAPDGDERFVVSGGHVAEPTPLADVLDLEDENHFRLLGRANDLIHVAGKRSSLAHLNFQLNRIAGVEDGAFWLPDEAAEAVVRPIAFVVAPALTAGAIIAALREELEPAFVPRRVLQVDALPREATGKLTVAALRQFALERLGAVAADADGDADAAVEVPFTVARDHPLWAGHFPGQPVLPGAVLIAFVMQATQSRASLRRRLGPAPCLQSAKFLHPVTPTPEPELQLLVRLCPQGSGVAFEVVHREITVASGLLRADGG